MRGFEKPMVTITQKHFEQLLECARLVDLLWTQFGPYEWPQEFRLPKGKSFADFHPESHEFAFYQFRSKINQLMEFDDSE